MPVIATVNLKEREIFNTTTFTIHVITPNSVKLSNVVDEIPLKDFTENFVLNFCSTIYKWHWQGSTITEPYAILDTNHMVRSRTLYTALSRAKIPDHIRLDPTTVNKQYYPRKQPELELSNAWVNSLQYIKMVNCTL